MSWWDAALPLVGAAGGLTGVAAAIQAIANRPRNVREKGEAEVAHIQSQIVVGSLEAAGKSVASANAERDAAYAKNSLLIDLAQDLIKALRLCGCDPEAHQDTLDDIRSM